MPFQEMSAMGERIALVKDYDTCRVPGSSGLINSFRLFQAMDVLRELIDEERRAAR